MDKANRSLGDAARTLDQWPADLASMQATAAQYEAEAAQTLQRLRAAESDPDLALAGQTFPDEVSLARAQARYDAATAELNIDQFRARRTGHRHGALRAGCGSYQPQSPEQPIPAARQHGEPEGAA